MRTRPLARTGLQERTRTQLPDADVAAMSAPRRRIYRVAVSPVLEYTTMGLIILNTVVMCINW